MSEPEPVTVHVGPSDDPHRPMRVALPDRAPLNLTADELVALQSEIRRYLLYRVAASRGGFSNSGG
ncbi:hypothetical protein [Embleya sp. MST-111070]|uniref:hypothetical protein n=1 Tax=Embleya sp. MST-111070 TaxID=3398231 RepID=UPI003F732D1C